MELEEREEVVTADRHEDVEGFRDMMIDGLSNIANKHLGDKLKLDLSSIMRGEIKIDPSHYIDKAVQEVVKRLEALNLQEFKLPDFCTNFNQPVCCLNLPGEASFKEGILSGFTSIKRFDQEKSEIVVDVKGDKLLSAKTTIGIDELAYSCPTTLNFLSLFESDSITKAVLKQIQLSVGFGIGRNFNVDLDMFDVKSTGKIQDFAGLPDSVLEVVQAALENTIYENVKKWLQQDLKTIFADVVSKLEFMQ